MWNPKCKKAAKFMRLGVTSTAPPTTTAAPCSKWEQVKQDFFYEKFEKFSNKIYTY